MDNHDRFTVLRNSFPEFVYESFSYSTEGNDITVSYRFVQSEDIVYRPALTFRNCPSSVSPKDLEAAFFNIGMMELISYYKACCSPKIIIKAGALTEEQTCFWKKLIYRGLGEFIYTNGIRTDEDSMFVIVPDSTKVFEPYSHAGSGPVMIPVGGGKDSVVTLELLSGKNRLPLILNPREASVQSVKNSGLDGYVRIDRTIDPLLLEMNAKGYLNGHTPFSALLAFVSAAAASISGCRDIALSNENSANEGNTFFSGIEINHQYSKSFGAEKDLHDYIRRYISPGVRYFSFLRPLNELKIAEIFSRFGRHFRSFRSCNAGSRENRWCCKCPKCLFTYIILSPFLERKKLTEIFGSDLLDDAELEKTFFELCGTEGIKPFECVGTGREVKAALARTVKLRAGEKLPYLTELFSEKEARSIDMYDNDFDSIMNEFSDMHLIPEEYLNDLRSGL